MAKAQAFKNRTQQKAGKSFFVSVFLGTLFSLLIGIFLLMIFCLAGLSLEDPDRLVPIFSLVALFVSAFFAGYLSARLHRETGFLCGALSGVFLIGILVLLAFACSFSIQISLFFICAPFAVVISAIAGVGGVRKREKPRKKKRF